MTALNIAVVGAGIAGISAAKALQEAGHQVCLFEKSRGSGGRMSSRRSESGVFDMGTQYFTARDSGFRQQLAHWLEAGWVAEWAPRLFIYDEAGLAESPDDQPRYVGLPRMTALSRGLLGEIPLVGQTRIMQLQRTEDSRWLLVDDACASHGPFDRVVIATPAPQAVPLLEQAPLLAQAAAAATMEAGWTLALAFDEALPTPVEACFVRSGPLDWISRNSSKPGRTEVESWVVQSTPEWAAQHIDRQPAEVASILTEALGEVLGLELGQPAYIHAHRWLYARPAADNDWGALAAPELGLYACGDWCFGGRLENAWLSGAQVARTLV